MNKIADFINTNKPDFVWVVTKQWGLSVGKYRIVLQFRKPGELK